MVEHKDIKLVGQGGVVPIKSIVIENSFDYYCSRVIVTAQLPLSGRFSLYLGGQSKDVDAVSFNLQNSLYETILFPSDFLDFNKQVFKPLKGMFTFEEILSTYGIQYITQKETSTEYWEVPQLRFINFIDFVRDKVSVMNGGGFLLTYSFGGLILCDLKTQMEKKPQATVYGRVTSQNYDWSWYQDVPGNLKLTQDYPDESITRDYVLNPNFSKSHLTELITNRKLEYLTERIGRNQFYRTYYQNMRYQIISDQPTVAVIGSTVAMADLPNDSKGVLTKTSFGTGQCVYTICSH